MKVPTEILKEVKALPGVEGILFTGSRQQGTATKDSDWDFYVLLEDGAKSFRKTWQRDGQFVEVFCNTIRDIEKHEFRRDKVSNPAVRMLATGDILFDKHGRYAEIQERAKKLYEQGPEVPDEQQRSHADYTLRAFVDDLEALEEQGKPGHYLQTWAIKEVVEQYYRFNQRWVPKPRCVEEDLEQNSPELFALYKQANEKRGAERVQAIIALIRHLAQSQGLPLSGEMYQERK